MSLYERVKQQKEVEAAGLEGLEECPFCEWKCVIENEQERLFRCGNEEGGCGVVSCRGCKKVVGFVFLLCASVDWGLIGLFFGRIICRRAVRVRFAFWLALVCDEADGSCFV